MPDYTYTASYAKCKHSFVLRGIPQKDSPDGLTRSFACVIRNILQRSGCVKPSRFLVGQLGQLPKMDDQLYLIDLHSELPRWSTTIKGAEDGSNPAVDFFYDDELWETCLPGYSWIRYLLIPEAPLSSVLKDDAEIWMRQAVDFYLPMAKLIIEIDGTQHRSDQKQVILDQRRDDALTAAGFTVIRISTIDLKFRSQSLQNTLLSLREYLDKTDEIQLFLEQDWESEQEWLRLHYEIVLRYQFALLQCLENGVLSLDAPAWTFDILSCDEEYFRIAADDLFLYFRNLYILGGMEFHQPDILFSRGEESLVIINHIYDRPDEREPQGIEIFNSPWDGDDFYQVSCADIVDYKIRWPLKEDDERAKALLFFMDNIFGYDSFNPGQWMILANILCCKRTIGILPTGGGKSLCYQLAAMLQPASSIVICPIISLQIDQKRNLHEAGMDRAEYISSIQETEEKSSIIRDFADGRYQIIWISPERLQSREFRYSLEAINAQHPIAYAVIDEVHCLSEWGHDFRTSYLTLISTLESCCPGATLVGLTATASQAVLNDLKVEFNVDGMAVRALPSLERKNLTFSVVRTKNKDKELNTILRQHRYGKEDAPDTGIVFTLTQDHTGDNASRSKNRLAGYMRQQFPQNKEEIAIYHANIENKQEVQNAFLDGKIRLLSSTKAFGMGVNKRDLRFTVHHDLPWSVEAFYQEAGRAGRDNKDADCFILFDPHDFGDDQYIDAVFAPATTPEQIQEYVDEFKINSDLRTIFLLWGKNNKGVDADLRAISKILEKISGSYPRSDKYNGKYYVVQSAPWKKNPYQYVPGMPRGVIEQALYRLKVLGVVKDWLITWRSGGDLFDIYLSDDLSEESVSRHFFSYLSAHRRRQTTYNDLDEKYREILSESEPSYILRYAKALLSWTYDHIIYSRREATHNILKFCKNYKDPESFRKMIDDFLRISEQSILLNDLVENEANWPGMWFNCFFTEVKREDGSSVTERLDRDGVSALYASAARYRESYQDLIGLNLVYCLAAAFSGNQFSENDELLILRTTFQEIKKDYSESAEDVFRKVLDLTSFYQSNMQAGALNTLAKFYASSFPEYCKAQYAVLKDPYSMSVLLRSLTGDITDSIRRLSK